MGSLLDGLRSRTDEILFLNQVLRQYREVRKVYHYDYSEEDKRALQQCSTDFRPFYYSFLPAGASYWGSGKLAGNTKGLGMMTRASLLLLRLAATAEVFRYGYLIGSYRQGMDCTQRLVSLRTPLGGEMAAIIRERDPEHPLLRFERLPAEMNEDGSRPRIMTEQNRLAQIAHLQQELSQAKAGQAVDRENERADERLFQIIRHREDALGEINRGGGPAAAAGAGNLEAMRPAQAPPHTAQYGGAAAGAGGSHGGDTRASITRGGGVVITDQPPRQELQQQLQQQLHKLQGEPAAEGAGSMAGSSGGGSGAAGGSSSAELDPFGMVLGGSGGGGWGLGDEQSDAARRQAAEEAARQQRRRERRGRWWHRHSTADQGE